MIARKSLLIVLNNIIGGLLGFVSLYFITNNMGADSLGILGFGLSFVGMFTFISNLGFDSAHNKRVSEGWDLGQCIGLYIRLKLKLTALMTAVSLLAIYIYGYLLGNFKSETEVHVTFIFLIYYMLWSLSLIAVTTFNALRRQAMAQIPSIVEFFVRSPMVILLAIIGKDIVSVAVVYVVGIGALLLLAAYFMKGLPVSKPDPALARSYAKFAAPMAVISFTTTFSIHLDKVMISAFAGNTQVGIYYGAQRIIIFLITTAAPLAVLLFPTISHYHVLGKLDDIRTVILSAERYLAMLVLPGVGLIAALSGPVMGIFGDDYTGAAAGWTLAFLAFYGFLHILNRPFSQVITGTGRTKLAVKITVTVLALNIALNLLLIPGWDFMPSGVMGVDLLSGAAGAAIATFAADTVRFIVVRRESGRIVGYRMKYGTMGKFLAAAVAASGTIYALHHHVLMPGSSLVLLPELALGFAIYLALLMMLKEFTRKDFDFFMDLLHPGKMKEYIHEEIAGKRGK